MAAEIPDSNNFSETVITLYDHWFKVYRKDDRISQFGRGRPPRGKEDAQIRSVRQILLPANLDDLNINKESEAQMAEACTTVVKILFEVSPKALEAWVEDHNEPIEFLADHNDPRVMLISKFAQAKLNEAKRS